LLPVGAVQASSGRAGTGFCPGSFSLSSLHPINRHALADTQRVAAYDPALVLQVLAVVVPFGLASAVSPVMLIEQTVILAGPDGKRASTRYAAGAALTLLLFVSFLVLFGRAISLPQEPHLDARSTSSSAPCSCSSRWPSAGAVRANATRTGRAAK
jgi:hypothetical protein